MKYLLLIQLKQYTCFNLTSAAFVLAFTIGLFPSDATWADVFGFSGRGTITTVDDPTNLYPDIQVGEPFWFELVVDDAAAVVDESSEPSFGEFLDVDIVRGILSYRERSNTVWETGSTLDSTSVFFGSPPTAGNFVIDSFRLSDTEFGPLPTEIVSPFLSFSFTAKRDRSKESLMTSDDWFESVKRFSNSWLLGDNFAEVTISGGLNTDTLPRERLWIIGDITHVVAIPEPTSLVCSLIAIILGYASGPIRRP